MPRKKPRRLDWKPAELSVIASMYAQSSYDDILAALPGRSLADIQIKANQLGLKRLKTTRPPKICAGCGSSFVVIARGSVVYARAKFCTHECSVKYDLRKNEGVRRENAESKKPDWKKARCKWCAEGLGFPFSSGLRLHGYPDMTTAGFCTAPTEAEYIAEIEEENARLVQANRYGTDVVNQALAARDKAQAVADEAVSRAIKTWLSSPAYQTYITLKHGRVGDILEMLHKHQISRSRACEALADLAHGIPPNEVRLPEPEPEPTELSQL